MSGICGIADWRIRPGNEIVNRMMDQAPYRGPDGRSHVCQDNASLGFMAHNLTPESACETQPLVHEASGVIICADIRLDNREELCSSGIDRSLSDSEVVLSLYLDNKERWAERLLGDFAIAIWDPRDKTVRLARDPMGPKCLYYRYGRERALWATEINQILAVPGVDRVLNDVAVGAHLCGVHIPVEMTFYKNIYSVKPGELVTLSYKGVNKRSFWQVDPGNNIKYRKEEEYGEHFRELFLSAVDCRLRSVKPVGISLSGGMDSGGIASTVGWLYENGLSRNRPDFFALNWAFDELPQCDERKQSGQITGRYGIPAIPVPADWEWPLRDYPNHAPHADSPYVFYYNELIDSVNRRAADEGAGLLITGERGDALVGHWVYDYPGLFNHMKYLALIREIRSHGRAMGLSFFNASKSLFIRPYLRKLLGRDHRSSLVDVNFVPSYLSEKAYDMEMVRTARTCVMPPNLFSDEGRDKRYKLLFSAMSVRRLEILERQQALHSLDHADPWSDRRLAEFILAIPQHIVHRFHDRKRLVRSALDPVLTEHLKDSYSTGPKADPTPLFMKGIAREARGTVEDLIGNSLAAELGYVNNNVLLRDYREACEGRPRFQYDIWWFLTMEMWLRKHWT